MTDRVHGWIERAQAQMTRGDVAGAIESLKRALGLDPEHAPAHALLALCLLGQRQLYVAQHEVDAALAIVPDLEFAQYVNALILTARRQYAPAERQLGQLLESDPRQVHYLRALGDLYGATARRREQREALTQALEVDPEDPDTLADWSRCSLQSGDVNGAEEAARAALELEPEHGAALVAMGHVLLAQGDVSGAKEHVLWALQKDPTDAQAVYLLAAVKARSNPFLGLWWRFTSWVNTLGETRALLVLLGGYVIYRLSSIAANDHGHTMLAGAITIAWLALVVYTFIGPVWFKRAVDKELRSVALKGDF